jgi:hypothetical protein
MSTIAAAALADQVLAKDHPAPGRTKGSRFGVPCRCIAVTQAGNSLQEIIKTSELVGEHTLVSKFRVNANGGGKHRKQTDAGDEYSSSQGHRQEDHDRETAEV